MHLMEYFFRSGTHGDWIVREATTAHNQANKNAKALMLELQLKKASLFDNLDVNFVFSELLLLLLLLRFPLEPCLALRAKIHQEPQGSQITAINRPIDSISLSTSSPPCTKHEDPRQFTISSLKTFENLRPSTSCRSSVSQISTPVNIN